MEKKKRIVYLLLVSFLVLMVIMTFVSRVMNESHIPEVETVSPASGNLKLSALGRGVVVMCEDIFMIKHIWMEFLLEMKSGSRSKEEILRGEFL